MSLPDPAVDAPSSVLISGDAVLVQLARGLQSVQEFRCPDETFEG